MEQNPYSLTFGREPHQMIHRESETDTILSSFCADPSPQQAYVITGLRGSGKTVLMNEIAKRLRERKDWIVIELNPERNLLEDMMSKLYSERSLKGFFSRSKIDLSFFGFGISISGTSPITNAEAALEKMLESLQKKGKRVLVAIDEVFSTPGIREFVHSFQIFIRKDYPLFLLMTGLYHNVEALQNEKSLTFLYRATKIRLQPLGIRAIAQNYEDTFRLSPKEARAMAEMTNGYSFAFQVLGYLTFERKESFRSVKKEYISYLADYAYDKILSELSAKDLEVLRGIARTGSDKLADIRATLRMDNNQINPYRKRLIQRGLLDGTQYGRLHFVLPYFREYLLELEKE